MEESGFWFLMSQRDGFSGGFFLGTVVGGLIGGAIGALLATRQFGHGDAEPEGSKSLDLKSPRRKFLKAPDGRADVDIARRSLEDKIAQLNEAIDDVRQQLGGVNGSVLNDVVEQPIAKDVRRQG
jgi:hypothetical protein